MTFNMTTSGAGWRLATSLIALGHEIEGTYPTATCLGTIGDQSHQSEGVHSDHNPFIKDPKTGLGIVRAIDIGGPLDVQAAISSRIYVLMKARDPRVYVYGYMHSDNQGTLWPAGTGWSIQPGDVGHLHISVTQTNGRNPTPAGYVSAIDSNAPWGIAPAPKPTPPPPEDPMYAIAFYSVDMTGTAPETPPAGIWQRDLFTGIYLHVEPALVGIDNVKALETSGAVNGGQITHAQHLAYVAAAPNK